MDCLKYSLLQNYLSGILSVADRLRGKDKDCLSVLHEGLKRIPETSYHLGLLHFCFDGGLSGALAMLLGGTYFE